MIRVGIDNLPEGTLRNKISVGEELQKYIDEYALTEENIRLLTRMIIEECVSQNVDKPNDTQIALEMCRWAVEVNIDYTILQALLDGKARFVIQDIGNGLVVSVNGM